MSSLGYSQNAVQTYDPMMSGGQAVNPPFAQAQDIREASLRNKADEAAKYLHHAHDLMDQLEDAIHGPAPKSGEQTNAPGPPPSLRLTLEQSGQRAASLVGRLSTLLASL